MRDCSKKRLSIVITVVFILQLFVYIYPQTAWADGGNTLTIKTLSNATDVFSGEEFTYTIQYSYSSTNAHNADGVVIEDNLPSEVQYISSLGSTDIESVSVNGQKVQFVFKSGLAAGTTGIVKIAVKFPNGTTLDGTEAVNTASISSPDVDSGNPVVSDPVTVTSKLHTPNWHIQKTKVVPQGDPVPGQPVTYALSVIGNSGVGQLNLTQVRLIDTLPQNAEYISSKETGTYDGTSNTVTWDLPDIGVGGTVTRYVTVSYPEDVFLPDDPGSIVTNLLDCTATLYGASISQGAVQASCTHGFTTPKPGAGVITKTSRQSNDEYSLGQTAVFYIGNIVNSGNVSLDDFTVEDTLPPQIDVTSITTGQYSDDISLTIKYITNLSGSWTVWGVYNNPNNTTLDVSSLPLQEGEYITNLQWCFGTVPSGFKNNRNITVSGTVLITGHDGKSVSKDDVITNSAVLKASYDGGGIGDETPVTAPVIVKDPVPWIEPSKSSNGQASFKPGDTVTYNLRVKNHDFATGDYNDPVVFDVLDGRLSFVSYEGVTLDGGNKVLNNLPQFTQDTVLGKTTLKWIWSSGSLTLQPGEYIDIKFKAKVADGTLAGTVPNTFYATTQDGMPFKSSISAVDDIYGQSINKVVPVSTNIFVKFIGSITSEMLVKGELDGTKGDVLSGWTKTPLYGNTLPGGIADYRLKISNSNANGPIKNIVIIDKLPHLGDTGVVDPSQRDSKWSPFLVNQISLWNSDGSLSGLPEGVKVFYSTNPNPSCSEFSDPINNEGSPGDDWRETPPDDITSIRSIKIDCRGYNGGAGLAPGESINLYWPMRAPVGAPSGQIAWNSFGYVATYPDAGLNPDDVIQQPFLPAEPVKVGFMVNSDPGSAYNVGNYLWEDMDRDGIQGSGEPGLNGVLVKLYAEGDLINPIAYTRTGYDQSAVPKPGYYNFPNVPSGNYLVEFTLPSEYYVTPKGQGSDRLLDSDIDSSGCTDIFSVTGNVTSIDAGIYRKAEFSGRVWKDLNGNGIQETGEPSLSGLNINLLTSGSVFIIDTKVTDAQGKYKFDNLDPDKYIFFVEAPDSSYVFTKKNATVDETKDSDVNSDSRSDDITLYSGDSQANWDAGMHRAIIGDYVWQDMDGDGIQDSGEPGINGVSVKLLDQTDKEIESATTATGGPGNKAGYYLFTDLDEGAYRVKFDIASAGFDKFSQKNVSGAPTASDSDADAAGLTDQVFLAPGEIDDTIDAGMYKYGAIGNFVWNDKDADGIQDAGEPGIQGASVNLLNKDMGILNTAITGVNGAYAFNNLDPGDYYVQFSVLDGEYILSSKRASGSNNGNDSNADQVLGITDKITLKSGQTDNSIDTGMHKASFGGFVWDDLDADGIMGGGEPILPGTQVDLLEGDETPILDGSLKPVTTITNSSGYYEFNDLSPGNYKVRFLKSASYSFTLFQNPLDPAKNSDAEQTTGVSEIITLGAGDRDITYDAGMYIPVTIGDFVWEDTNGNGVQDNGENGVSGVIVNLYKGGSKEAGRVTGADGSYSFAGLIPGSYTLEFVRPDGYEFTTASQDAEDKDSDPDKILGTISITLTSGSDDYTLDAGLYRPVSIGSIVWEDSNIDGIRDTEDTGIEGAAVNLYKDGSFTGMAQTDKDGKYSFTGLVPGNYSVEFLAPAGYEYTGLHKGGDSSKDSDAGLGGKTQDIVLNSGEASTAVDAGFFRRCAVGDFVWEDANGNGVQDPGEQGIGSVTVNLYDSKNVLMDTVSTVGDGSYSFLNLLPGDYRVEFMSPAGYEPSAASKDGTIIPAGKSMVLTLVSGQVNYNMDAGFYRRGSIGDFVWEDRNANGIQDADEKGMGSVKVNLYDNAGTKLSETTTGPDGTYLFSNLIPGQYILEFIRPSGYVTTAAYQGTDAAKDSNAGPGGKCDAALFSGQNIDSIDAGFRLGPSYTPADLGDYVWEDSNYNGIQDAGEKGIGGIVVNLINSYGSKVSTVFTDSNGRYIFSGLFPGRYTIEFKLPFGYEFTRRTQGGNPEEDSNAGPDGRTQAVDLVSGETDTTIDAGLFKSGEIGSIVWEDIDKNGIRDPGEEGVPGVTVNLYNSDGNKIKTAVTALDGTYRFTGLIPESYRVGFEKPSGYEFTMPLQGDDSSKNSKAGENGLTNTIVLSSGQIEGTINAGLYKVVVPVEETHTKDDSVLPKTGNGYYGYLALGCLLCILSAAVMIFGSRKQKKPKH